MSESLHIPDAVAAPSPPSAGGQPPRRAWRILVVEDVPSLQRLLVLMLQKAGHTVVTADNGLDAIDFISRDAFDAVLMDIQMPGMDGLEATRTIRQRETGTDRRLPIVAITAHALSGDASACREAGADEYLRKPIDLGELMATLNRLIG